MVEENVLSVHAERTRPEGDGRANGTDGTPGRNSRHRPNEGTNNTNGVLVILPPRRVGRLGFAMSASCGGNRSIVSETRSPVSNPSGLSEENIAHRRRPRTRR